MSERTGQLYIVHNGGIHALKDRTVESVREDWRRIRISQLRRMVEASLPVEERVMRAVRHARGGYCFQDRHAAIARKMDRFRDRCRAEIERLRGEG